MNIDYLVDRPNDIPEIIRFLYGEWGEYYSTSKKIWEKRINSRLNKKILPITFVASIDDKLVGTASITVVEDDLEIKKKLSPWLTDVFVLNKYRGNKIATKLIQRALEEARFLGLYKLYLFTQDAEKLYQKLNWSIIEKFNYCGDEHSLMEYSLNSEGENNLL